MIAKRYIDDNNKAARQMNKQHDIFVSYAHVDNEPLPGADKGWVTTLINGLKVFLGQKLGHTNAYSLWIDNEVRGNTAVTPHIIEQLENAAIFLLILSPAYLESQWCRLELSLFLAQVDEKSGCVFVVERDEIEPPESLSDLLGYKFWIKDDRGRTHTLAMPKPHPEEFEYFQKLDDLAHELSDKIKSLKKAEKKQKANAIPPIQKVTPTSHGHTVFLALVSDDLEEYRDDTKRYLEQQGVQVLPNQSYSLFDSDFQQQLKRDLKQCDLFVQLLSEKIGHELPQKQYEYANAINLPIFQWCDKRLDLNKIPDQDHKRLLMKNTVIVSTVIEFQECIIDNLKLLNSETSETIDQENNGPLVFINAAEEDMSLAYQIHDIFKAQKIGSVLPLGESNRISAADMQKFVEQNLLACDAVIVIYDNTPVVWVNEQVLYCRRIQGLREQPFKVLALCDKPSTEKPSFPMYLPNLHILECPTLQTKTGLPEFIRILRT